MLLNTVIYSYLWLGGMNHEAMTNHSINPVGRQIVSFQRRDDVWVRGSATVTAGEHVQRTS